MKTQLCSIALVAYLLAGCAMSADNKSNDVETATPSSMSSTESQIVDSEPTASNGPTLENQDRLEGTNCTSAGSRFTGPVDVYQEEVPDGWQHDASQGFTFVNHLLLTCHRVSWGLLERPLAFMLEGHQSFLPPEPCRGEGRNYYLLANAWWNDEAIHLQAGSFGIASRLGAHDRTTQGTEGIELDSWSWSSDGQPVAKLEFSNSPPQLNVSSLNSERFFWFTSTGVSYLDFDLDKSYDQVASPLVTGEFASDTFYGSFGNPYYAGVGETHHQSNFSAEIHEFRGLLCAEPL